jgi:peptidyl-prolyl cis-trans isomerase SurA
MRARVLVAGGAAFLLAGCAIPGWVPFLGDSGKSKAPASATPAPAPQVAAPSPSAAVRGTVTDVAVADRVVAVVNNDAITLGEIQESIAVYRQENREATVNDDELAKQALGRLIDARLQLQEADRERIFADDQEVTDELADRIRKNGLKNEEDLNRILKKDGISLDSVKRRLRDSIRVAKITRRKVTLRVSVTDDEITTYLINNRDKLETGLSYHAFHILIQPEVDTDAGWEAARITADMVRAQANEGSDFAELARKYSRDATAKDGGDLGTLKRGELAQDVEATILTLQPGQVSMPFRSSLGWHVFKLQSKETLEGDALARARQQIRDILFREKFDARLDAWLKEIKQRAIIEVRL